MTLSRASETKLLNYRVSWEPLRLLGPRGRGGWNLARRSPSVTRSLYPKGRTYFGTLARCDACCEDVVFIAQEHRDRCNNTVKLRGGNQRELARQKNMKKTQEISKGKRKEDSLTTSQRKQRDSEIMQQKQKAANEKKSMQRGEK
ncbi:small EDRK-rich factor 1 [Fukomys damarensis]|uniref:small EDRK-rich factor 1 n=1 Tax=Fukomys damarensis TaxID=885580 RepID=UPI00145526F7|nr:small EDRK-rich factor 1 [Fukomys damarensis]